MQGELLCMARKMTAGHGDARDLLQETALRALDNEEKYTPGTNLRGWVFTIMQRIFAGRCRRAAYGVVLLPSVCEAFPAASRAEAGGDAEAACDLGAARRAVAVLPASFRVPFVLYVSGVPRPAVLGQIFQENSVPPVPPGSQRTDRKLRQKIRQKKIALGQKPDDPGEQGPAQTL